MKHVSPLLLTVLFVFLLCAAPLAAQDLAPISTDRPGFGTGTAVVAPGRVQIEAGTPGVQLVRTERDGRDEENNIIEDLIQRERRSISFPTLVRVGLVDGLELRVSSGVYTFFRDEVSYSDDAFDNSVFETEGFPGFTVGAKAQVLRQPNYTLALVPRVSLPFGDDAFTAERVGYAADAVLGTALFQQIGFTLVAGGALSPVPGDDYALSGNFVGVASRSLTEQIGGYVEGAFQPREDAENAGYLGTGLTYRIIPTAQLDVFFDRGLTEASSDWLFGGGISIRFGD